MKRRDFINYSSAAGLGLLFFPGCSTPTKEKDSRSIGVQLYTVRDSMEKDPIGTIKKISQIGYTEVECAGYRNGQYYGMTPKEFRKVLDDNGLSMPSGHYLTGNQDPSIVGTLNNGWEQAIEDAVAVGQKYMVLAYLFDFERKTLDDYKNLIDIINAKAELVHSAGLQFCYHNHDFEFIPLDGEVPMDLILSNTDSQKTQMELDLYWISKVDLDPIEFFNKYPNRVPLWHVKDMDASEDKKFTEVGSGTIDFNRIFKNAEISGMKHFFVEQDVCQRPPLESLTISHKYVSEII